MKLHQILGGFFLFFLLYSCSPTKKSNNEVPLKRKDSTSARIATDSERSAPVTDPSRNSPFLVDLLRKYPEYFDSIIANRKKWNVQIIYTQVNRDEHNQPHLKDFFFNVDSSQYYYPASTVKLPIVLLSLQKLKQLSKTGISRNTTMITEAAYPGQLPTYNDPLTRDGRPNIEGYIKRILLVSDNDAFNRLYEFLGQGYINEQLHARGYPSAQILHRLEVSLTGDENRHTNPVTFLDSNDQVFYQQPMQFNREVYAPRHDLLGTAYIQDGKLVNHPMDFSGKNRLCLEDLHHILKSIIFPGTVRQANRFDIPDSDYSFLLKYLSEYPPESVYPPYDSLQYPDAYGKFLLFGAKKGAMPRNIRIFNKEGDAYGQLVDAAYIVDFTNKIEFFLSATINCNLNQVLNDDHYAYDSLGLPFMMHLGEIIYQYEKSRYRQYPADLSRFEINYDK